MNMMQTYIEYHFTIQPFSSVISEILVAELSQQGFESFVDTPNGVLAYIQERDWHKSILDSIFILSSTEHHISYQLKKIEPVNWNKEWEKNFSPIQVDDICCIRAPFHDKQNTKYEIVIEPKMSFGTGHHQTTYMMLQYIFEKDFSNLSVLDMGSGTGVLAIATALKGATKIDAIDIDTWCFENAIENINRNQVPFINVQLGDASLIGKGQYDIIIANINRNILLNDMHRYSLGLKPSGRLIISGFYSQDKDILMEEAKKHNLYWVSEKLKDDWMAIELYKKTA